MHILPDAVEILIHSHRPKPCGNCAFPQNFHTRKSGENTLFFAVTITISITTTTITTVYF